MGNLGKLVLSKLSSKDVPLHNLEESFLTEIMEYWTTLNHENNLVFTSSEIWYNSLKELTINQSSIILVHYRSKGFDNMLNKQVNVFRHNFLILVILLNLFLKHLIKLIPKLYQLTRHD